MMDSLLVALVGLIGVMSIFFFGSFFYKALLKHSLKKYGNVIIDGVILEEKNHV